VTSSSFARCLGRDVKPRNSRLPVKGGDKPDKSFFVTAPLRLVSI